MFVKTEKIFTPQSFKLYLSDSLAFFELPSPVQSNIFS